MESDIDVDSLVAKWNQTKVIEQEKNGILEDRKSFVLVLMDGDITLFLDDYVTRGSEGGRDAAIALYTLITEQVQRVTPSAADCEVVVMIYANSKGLARTYQRSGVVDEARVWQFFDGFNKERIFCEFTDAGEDKEAADRKIKGNFELYWSLPQCKRIVLAGSGDRGYVGFLREYTQYATQCERLALLKGLPFHRDFEALASRLDVIEASHIFRGHPLPEVSSSQVQPASPSNGHVSASYSHAVASAVPSSSSFPPPGRSPFPPSESPVAADEIAYNAVGHRIDPKVYFIKQLRDRFLTMPERYCFDYHLRHCPKTEDECLFVHGERLPRSSYDTLLWIARSHPCRSANCSRPLCYMGHQCSYGPRCNRTCKFSGPWHNVDMKVVRNAQTG